MDLLDYLKKVNKEDYPEGYVDEILSSSAAFLGAQRDAVKYLFGYPSNLEPLSPLTKYLFVEETLSPLANNCGDPFEQGNYHMDNKVVEQKIVGLFAKKFGVEGEYWGYVTSGGSESNSCGIDLLFAKQSGGTLFYSQSAHYSVAKHAKFYKHIVVPCADSEGDEVDKRLMVESAVKEYETCGNPANIVLTFGTTKYGCIDDYEYISSKLTDSGVPHYIHLDAALFGGIPNNQTGAPKIENLKENHVNSVCVSLHKYIGFLEVKSVIVSLEIPKGEYIPYIGQTDTTVSGSRSMPSYTLYNHLTERLTMADEGAYMKNVIFFENLLKERKVKFFRADKSDFFVLDEPSESVCRKYQLSCFTSRRGERKAHVIIFPYHSISSMTSLADDLAQDEKNRR